MRPLDPSRWNAQTAAHLLNRAGFGATMAEVQTAAKRAPADVVDELVNYPGKRDIPAPAFLAKPDAARYGLPPVNKPGLSEDERRKVFQEAQVTVRQQMVELRAWWLHLMRHTRHPLQEKLTLFWHGHFATSQEKVKSPGLIHRQNQLFREHGHGNWENLLVRVSQDPAMLLYLDNARSTSRQPNENYARELMELFSLGEGHYTEDDIKAAARAFTGWSLDRETMEFRERPFMHDDGQKTFFGKTGTFDGRDIIRLITAHRESPRFITRKLWEFFAYAAPSDAVVDELSALLVKSKLELKPLLKAMFLSEEFYSTRALRTQIKSPVQWYVGLLRALEAPMPPPQFSILALRTLGQEIFAPPNVKGWDGGPAWITSANLLNRYNLAGILVKGGAGMGMGGGMVERFAAAQNERMDERMADSMEESDPAAQAQRRDRVMAMIERGIGRMGPVFDPAVVLPSAARASREATRDHLFQRLFQDPLREKDRRTFDDFLASQPPPAEWSRDTLGHALHLLTSTPQFQLT